MSVSPAPDAPSVAVAPPSDFESLLAPQLDAAYGLALHLTREAADAQDVVQEAALLACRHFARFEPGTNFRAWFLRIVVNCFYSRCRRTKRERRLLEASPEPDSGDEGAPVGHGERAGADVSAEVIDRLERAEVVRALAALPDEFRTVCVLFFLQDQSYQMIATQLDLPIGTVRSRLHRGRRLLRAALRGLAEERGLTIVSEEVGDVDG